MYSLGCAIRPLVSVSHRVLLPEINILCKTKFSVNESIIWSTVNNFGFSLTMSGQCNVFVLYRFNPLFANVTTRVVVALSFSLSTGISAHRECTRSPQSQQDRKPQLFSYSFLVCRIDGRLQRRELALDACTNNQKTAFQELRKDAGRWNSLIMAKSNSSLWCGGHLVSCRDQMTRIKVKETSLPNHLVLPVPSLTPSSRATLAMQGHSKADDAYNRQRSWTLILSYQ